MDGARQRSLETCQLAFPRPRLASFFGACRRYCACEKSLRYRLEVMFRPRSINFDESGTDGAVAFEGPKHSLECKLA